MTVECDDDPVAIFPVLIFCVKSDNNDDQSQGLNSISDKYICNQKLIHPVFLSIFSDLF